jgi:predicted signal transduction protein with EAL and GGDEF domain
MGRQGKLDGGFGKQGKEGSVAAMDMVPPRVRAVEVITAFLEGAKLEGGGTIVLVVKLEHAAEVSAALGDPASRLLFSVVQERLASALDRACFVHRLNVDSMVIAAPTDAASYQKVLLSMTVVTALSRPFSIYKTEVNLLHRVGVASTLAGGTPAEELLRKAEAATLEPRPGRPYALHGFTSMANTTRSG